MPVTDGITSAANALRYWERRQEVATNNLANANTDGFKGERVFARLMGESTPAPESATDRTAGTLRVTGNSLDLALQGDGFLVVRGPRGEEWTRGGAFQLDAEGYLADADGSRVLGERGPIRLTHDAEGRPIKVAAGEEGIAGMVHIDRGGLVTVGGVTLDRLRVERATAPGSLTHAGGTRFLPDASRVAVDAGSRGVHQGKIEESNVNTISSLVDLIGIQRNYAFAQKVLTTLDAVRSTITNDLGKPVG